MKTQWMLFALLIVVSALAAFYAYGAFTASNNHSFEGSRLWAAGGILAGCAFIFVVAMLLFAFEPESRAAADNSPGRVIFEACVKVIPPIMTLIIGFYFGSHNPQTESIRPSESSGASAAPASK